MNSDPSTPTATTVPPQDTPVLANLTTRPQEDDSSKEKTTQMDGEQVPSNPTYAEALATADPAPRSVQDRIPPDIPSLKGSSRFDLIYRRELYLELNPSVRREKEAELDKLWEAKGKATTINLVEEGLAENQQEEGKEEEDDATVEATNSCEKLKSVRCFLFMHLKKDQEIDESTKEGRNVWMAEQLNDLLPTLKERFQIVKLAPWTCGNLVTLPESEFQNSVEGTSAFFNRYFYEYNPFVPVGQSQNMRVQFCVPWDTDMGEFTKLLNFWRAKQLRRIEIAPSQCIRPVLVGGFMRSYPEMAESEAFKKVFMKKFNLTGEVGFKWDYLYLWDGRINSRSFLQMEMEAKDKRQLPAIKEFFKGKQSFFGARMPLLPMNWKSDEQQKARLKRYLENAQEVATLGTSPFTMEGIRLHKYVDEAKGITLLLHLLQLKPKRSYTQSEKGKKKLIKAPLFESIIPGDTGTFATFRSYQAVKTEAESVILGLPKYIESVLKLDPKKFCSKAHITDCNLGRWDPKTNEFISAEAIEDEELFKETAALAGIQIADESAATNQQAGIPDANGSVASTLSSLTEKTTESKRQLCKQLQAEKVLDDQKMKAQEKAIESKNDELAQMRALLSAHGITIPVPALPAVAKEINSQNQQKETEASGEINSQDQQKEAETSGDDANMNENQRQMDVDPPLDSDIVNNQQHGEEQERAQVEGPDTNITTNEGGTIGNIINTEGGSTGNTTGNSAEAKDIEDVEENALQSTTMHRNNLNAMITEDTEDTGTDANGTEAAEEQTLPNGSKAPSPFRKGNQLKQSLQQVEQTRTYSTPESSASSRRKSQRIAQEQARSRDGAGKSP